MPKIQQIKKTLMVSIPSQVARIKGWQKGTELYLQIDEKSGKVVMEKVYDKKDHFT